MGDEAVAGPSKDLLAENITKKGFVAGDVICPYTLPVVTVVLTKCKGSVCDSCCKWNANLLLCANCKLMWYCDKVCQAKDWHAAHKYECRIIPLTFQHIGKQGSSYGEGFKDYISKFCRLFSFVSLHLEGLAREEVMWDGSKVQIADLVSIEDHFCRPDYLYKTLNLLREDGIHLNRTTKRFVLRLVNAWKRNALNLMDESSGKDTPVAAGLYLATLPLKHSCKPTAHCNTLGTRMEVRALADIPEGSVPSVCHVNGHHSFKKRAEMLMDRCGLVCKCEICEMEKIIGDLVDYAKLNRITEQMQRRTQSPQTYMRLHFKVMRMMEKIYHQYDPRVTLHILSCVKGVMDTCGPAEMVDELLKETDVHMSLTYGQSHPRYKQFATLHTLLSVIRSDPGATEITKFASASGSSTSEEEGESGGGGGSKKKRGMKFGRRK